MITSIGIAKVNEKVRHSVLRFELVNTLAANSLVSLAWGGCVQGDSQINAFLESIDKSRVAVRLQKGGEAKFLRALAYYNFVLPLW